MTKAPGFICLIRCTMQEVVGLPVSGVWRVTTSLCASRASRATQSREGSALTVTGKYPTAETPQPFDDFGSDTAGADDTDCHVTEFPPGYLAAIDSRAPVTGVRSIWRAARPSTSASACSQPRWPASRRRFRRRSQDAPPHDRSIWLYPALLVEMYLTPARWRARSVAREICDL